MSHVVEYVHTGRRSPLAWACSALIKASGARKNNDAKARASTDSVSEPADVPAAIRQRFSVTTTQFEGRPLWTIGPRTGPSSQTILYLHGGAYVMNIVSLHWKLIAAIIERTNATVVVPDYPLAGQATCTDVFTYLEKLTPVFDGIRQGRPWTIMGDSAGGGLSYAWAQHLRDVGGAQPDEIVLLSPWLDVRMVDPRQDGLEKLDPMLPRRNSQKAGEAYAGGLSLTDPRVSPLFGDLENLPEVSIFTGTYDLVNADARSLSDALKAKGLAYRFFEYPKLFHVFMAVTFLPEAKTAIGQIAGIVAEAGR